MTNKTQPQQVDKNFSFSLFTAVERDFEKALEGGCYQKKALLTKLLKVEIERLDKAIEKPVPKKVTQFIRDTQNNGDLKKYWSAQQVLLPSTLVDRIQEVCKKKGVVRDAWVNRVIFLATATNLFHALLPLDDLTRFDYFRDSGANRDDAIELTTLRLTAPLDPLLRLHEVFCEIEDPNTKEAGNLYRFKIFEAQRRPIKPMPHRQDAALNSESKRLRTDWLLHKLSWCMTCWAEEPDLKQVDEPDWDELGL